MSRFSYEGYIAGPRMRLPDGIMRKIVIQSGLPIKLTSETRTTSLFRATVFFTVEGEEPAVDAFIEMLGTIQ